MLDLWQSRFKNIGAILDLWQSCELHMTENHQDREKKNSVMIYVMWLTNVVLAVRPAKRYLFIL